jgi:hypothetical protein
MSFKRIWSEAQQEACIETCCDFGYSAAKCAKAAAAGGLPGKGASLEPFSPPAATVSSWARVERIRRQELEKAQVNPTDSMMAGAGQLLGEWQHRVMKASSARGKNKPGTDELSRLADAGRKIKALIVELNAPPKQGRHRPTRPDMPDTGQSKATQGPGETEENDGTGFIEALAKDPQRREQRATHNGHGTAQRPAQSQAAAIGQRMQPHREAGEGGSKPDRALDHAV